MRNKKGGFGAKLVLVLILMIASAVGGAYGYRVLDGKLASRDALKAIENVDVSDYDTAEQSIIQGYIDNATKDLETAKTRKEVYEIISVFISDVDEVQTANEKKLEEALKAAEEAKQLYNNSQNSNQSTYGSDTTTDDSGTYKSNDLSSGSDTTTDEEKGGLLNSLLGGLSNNSDGN